MSSWDVRLFYLINQSSANSFFDWLMPTLSNANKSVWFWLPVAAVLAVVMARSGKRGGLYVLALALTIVLSNEACDLLKHSLQLLRPASFLSDVRLPPGVSALTSSGFPSAHAANMMALATLTMLIWGRRASPALMVPLVIGYSRLYVGAHFPSQVLGGYITGAAVAGLVFWLLRGTLSRPGRASQGAVFGPTTEGRMVADEPLP